MFDAMASLLPAFLGGAAVTVEVTVLALATGLLAGLVLALLRVYSAKPLAALTTAYITFVRALPEMVALFVFFFALGSIIPMPALVAAVLALSAISSAAQAEIIRGAIQSVGAPQMIAARALGMSKPQAVRSVILPQAFRFALPPWSNVASGMIKNSSLIYALGIPELLRQAQYASSRTLDPFTAYSLAAMIYLALTAVTTWSLRRVEWRVAIPT